MKSQTVPVTSYQQYCISLVTNVLVYLRALSWMRRVCYISAAILGKTLNISIVYFGSCSKVTMLLKLFNIFPEYSKRICLYIVITSLILSMLFIRSKQQSNLSTLCAFYLLYQTTSCGSNILEPNTSMTCGRLQNTSSWSFQR